MNGPEHYRAAERLLDHANIMRNEVASRTVRRPLTNTEERVIADFLLRAELDMKAAHVHAMLAVAGATVADRLIGPPTLVGGSQRTKASPEWDYVHMPTRVETGENDG